MQNADGTPANAATLVPLPAIPAAARNGPLNPRQVSPAAKKANSTTFCNSGDPNASQVIATVAARRPLDMSLSTSLPSIETSIVKTRIPAPNKGTEVTRSQPFNEATSAPPPPPPAAAVAASASASASAFFATTNGEAAATAGPRGLLDYLRFDDGNYHGSLYRTTTGSVSLMNGFEVPERVLSAGGLQSLSSLSDHRSDHVANELTLNAGEAAPAATSAQVESSTAPAAPAAPAAAAAATAAATDEAPITTATVDTAAPAAAAAETVTHSPLADHLSALIPPPVPTNGSTDTAPYCPAAQVPLDGCDSDASNISDDLKLGVPLPDKAAPNSGDDVDSALTTDVDVDSAELTSTAGTDDDTDGDVSDKPQAQNPSILVSHIHRRTRSAESVNVETVPFHNRIVKKREGSADLRCFEAYQYIAAFYDEGGYRSEDMGSGSSQSSLISRPSSRTRQAVVQPPPQYKEKKKKRRRRILTDEQRKKAFTTTSIAELYEQLSTAYRFGRIQKGYLDTLYMAEVHNGHRELRPHDARHATTTTGGCGRLSPVSGDDMPTIMLSSTETAEPEYNWESVRMNTILQGMGRTPGTGAAEHDSDTENGGRNGKQGGSAGQLQQTRWTNSSDGTITSTSSSNIRVATQGTIITTNGVGQTLIPRASRSARAYEFLLNQMQKKAVRFDYQRNRMSLSDYRFVKRSGAVRIHGRTLGLHLWDDKKTGYLVTGVFDHSVGYPKNYEDPVTADLYADEMEGGVATSFPVPELIRQHAAVNSRNVYADEKLQMRGCSFIHKGDVFGIYDGRVHGCQVARCERDYRRTGMHSAIQSLVHYMNLFREYPSLLRILHPQDVVHYPVVNPAGGMYCFPLIINGAARLVKVDDYFPIDPLSGVFRCLTSSANELFPALLEKALLKANGGGVNVYLMEPCNVVHQLCGWIPQIIPLVNDGAASEASWFEPLFGCDMWDSLSEMYMRGRLVMSFVAKWPRGVPDREAGPMREKFMNRPDYFVTPIAFPVLDMITRVEPGEDGQPPHRLCAVMLRDTTKDPLKMEFEPPVQTRLSEETLSSLGYTNAHRDAGVFCVTWEEAMTYFDHCSVSYNPYTYWSRVGPTLQPREATRLCFHDVYDMRKSGQWLYCQPQYHLLCNDVDMCAHVFCVVTPHTSMQAPVPWPCRTLSNAAVDRLSNGYGAMRLRVYEVTKLPSLLQAKGRHSDGVGEHCTFGACVGRRLCGETIGLERVGAIATAVGYVASALTLSFDVPPGTREYVVVLDVEVDPRVPARDRLRDFPYSLTLYTNIAMGDEENPRCLPVFGGRVKRKANPAADAKAASNTPAASAKPTPPNSTVPVNARDRLRRLLEKVDGMRNQVPPSVLMHSVSSDSGLDSRSYRAQWRLSTYLDNRVTYQKGYQSEECWTGTQYHLRLTKPDNVIVRMVALRSNSARPPAAQVRLLVVRRLRHRTLALSGNIASQCELALLSGSWNSEGAELDTSMPHILYCDDEQVMLKDVQQVQREKFAMISVSVCGNGDDLTETPQTLTVVHPDLSDRVQSLVIRAFAEGKLLSPASCRLTCMGKSLSPETRLRALFDIPDAPYRLEYAQPAVKEKQGGGQLSKGHKKKSLPPPPPQPSINMDVYVDVEVSNTSPYTAADFPDGSTSGQLLRRLRWVAAEALRNGGAQRTKAWRALFHIGSVIQQSHLPEKMTFFLLGITRGIADWIGTNAAQRADPSCEPPPQHLRQLSPGDYLVIPLFMPNYVKYVWHAGGNGLPAWRETLRPEEELSFTIAVEACNQRVDLTAIPSSIDPLAPANDPQTCLFNVAKRSVDTAR